MLIGVLARSSPGWSRSLPNVASVEIAEFAGWLVIRAALLRGSCPRSLRKSGLFAR